MHSMDKCIVLISSGEDFKTSVPSSLKEDTSIPAGSKQRKKKQYTFQDNWEN